MSVITIGIVVIVYAALLAYYIMLEKQEKFRNATIIKVVLSAIASGCAIFAAIIINSYVFYIFALGMIFAVPADYFLQYIKINLMKYRVGIFFFGLMHICLLVSFYILYPVSIVEFIIFTVFIGILLAFQLIGKWQIGEEKLQLTIYTVLVVLMASKAVSLFFTIPNPLLFILFVSLGGLFFFVSDLFLGIWAYSKEKFVYLALNRIIYFTGQLCLAFYLVFIW
ncbi:MAG: lysoplasmalogenase [Oscillospiraceae bacterium]|nr:lysoplasmalogenase [Oscillospiraceae bacterium]